MDNSSHKVPHGQEYRQGNIGLLLLVGVFTLYFPLTVYSFHAGMYGLVALSCLILYLFLANQLGWAPLFAAALYCVHYGMWPLGLMIGLAPYIDGRGPIPKAFHEPRMALSPAAEAVRFPADGSTPHVVSIPFSPCSDDKWAPDFRSFWRSELGNVHRRGYSITRSGGGKWLVYWCSSAQAHPRASPNKHIMKCVSVTKTSNRPSVYGDMFWVKADDVDGFARSAA